MIKPDNALDDIERAHLVDPRESFYAIDRFAAPPDLSELARRHWIPVWDLPEGESSTQEVLQYPVCLIVISNSYARFYGVQSGLSRTTLSGTGWASGVMLQPAAGSLVLGGDVRTMTDRFVDAREILDGALVAAVRSAMADPNDPECRRASAAVLDDALRAWLPVDEEGLLVNAIVEAVETEPDIGQVAQVCQRFAITERSLQRLLRRRIGLSPKWLIQRRRLHEASERLRSGPGDLAGVAHDLGYADQAHFTRDFRLVTGMTPGAFARRFSGARPPV